MDKRDGFSDLQALQKTIARANNARLPLEGDFHVITSSLFQLVFSVTLCMLSDQSTYCLPSLPCPAKALRTPRAVVAVTVGAVAVL